MTTEHDLDAIYQAKIGGMSDEAIMRQFSVGLREIEKAVVRKTGTNLNLYSSKSQMTHLNPKEFTPESTTVWSFKNRGRWATHTGDYRGNWSPYIPRNVILRYSAPGSLVLDQFCGAGTTAVEARLLGRRCIARDISPTALALVKKNLDFEVPDDDPKFYNPVVEVGDARKLHDIQDNSVDLICTHPPYADIVHYTDGMDGDLSFHHTEEFIEDMKLVARECFRVLKPDAVCAILIGDTRKNKMVVPIGFRTIEAFVDEGFVLKDLIVKRQHNCRTNGYWYSSSIRYNFLLLAQEYLPVFVKPSASRDKCRTRIQEVECAAATIAEKPVAPEKLECKTTWVLPADDYESLLERNLYSRYGGNGIVARVSFSSNACGTNILPVRCELVYVDRPERRASSLADLDVIATTLTSLVAEYSPKIPEGGHLVVRTKDLYVEEQTLSTAVKLWRVPGKEFRIREIVVVTSDSTASPYSVERKLEIAHEYLLVYQKISGTSVSP